MSRTDEDEAFFATFLTILIIVIVCALVWAVSDRYAHAAPAPGWGTIPPEVSAWAKQQHNARGEWCCDESDGHPYFGDVTFLPDGGVILDGGHTIPAELVLKGKNPTGHAVWWYRVISGYHRDYCFSPGTLG